MSDTSAINRKCDVCKTRDATLRLIGGRPTLEIVLCNECHIVNVGQFSNFDLTHSPDCWRHHPECAVKRIERVLCSINEHDGRGIYGEVADKLRAIIAGEE